MATCLGTVEIPIVTTKVSTNDLDQVFAWFRRANNQRRRMTESWVTTLGCKRFLGGDMYRDIISRKDHSYKIGALIDFHQIGYWFRLTKG